MRMMNKIIYGELLAMKEGKYTVYVFEDVNTHELHMCTKLPNWQVPDLNIGDRGYFEIQYVQAGENYFRRDLNMNWVYQYSNVYFVNFINESKTDNKDIIL